MPLVQGDIRNRLLSGLSASDFAMLRPRLEPVSLNVRHVFEEPGMPIETICFPEPGVVSIVAINAAGEKLEVGVVGPEGMTGLAVVNGTDRSPHQTYVQIKCSAHMISAAHLRLSMTDSSTLSLRLQQYSRMMAVQVAHTALACGRYSLDERLARWLLMCQDRVDGNEIGLTHEFLSLMLGVRRAGVTTAVHILEGARIIRAERGLITIRDRSALEEIAGDCYGTPEAEYERVMGPRRLH